MFPSKFCIPALILSEETIKVNSSFSVGFWFNFLNPNNQVNLSKALPEHLQDSFTCEIIYRKFYLHFCCAARTSDMKSPSVKDCFRSTINISSVLQYQENTLQSAPQDSNWYRDSQRDQNQQTCSYCLGALNLPRHYHIHNGMGWSAIPSAACNADSPPSSPVRHVLSNFSHF